MFLSCLEPFEYEPREGSVPGLCHITVLGLVGGAPAQGREPRLHNSVPPFKQNRLGNPLEQCATLPKQQSQ